MGTPGSQPPLYQNMMPGWGYGPHYYPPDAMFMWPQQQYYVYPPNAAPNPANSPTVNTQHQAQPAAVVAGSGTGTPGDPQATPATVPIYSYPVAPYYVFQSPPQYMQGHYQYASPHAAVPVAQQPYLQPAHPQVLKQQHHPQQQQHHGQAGQMSPATKRQDGSPLKRDMKRSHPIAKSDEEEEEYFSDEEEEEEEDEEEEEEEEEEMEIVTKKKLSSSNGEVRRQKQLQGDSVPKKKFKKARLAAEGDHHDGNMNSGGNTSDHEEKKRGRKKGVKQPRKPQTGYHLFCHSNRQRVVEENPEMLP